MGGQVLGGGVVVVVAVALWLLYLLPSWHSRHQFTAAERNAVRLNQALRVLAETSETPAEVRLELSARTALAQQRLARQALAERERAQLEESRVDLERARAEALAVRARPEARRARIRRRMRAFATVLGVASLATVGAGTWMLVAQGAQALLWIGGSGLVASLLVLQRMAGVATREAARLARPAQPQAREVDVQDVALDETARSTWEPRSLPRPLVSSVGSRAAVVRDAEDAREALRRAALEEAKRERAARAAPPSIDAARGARAEHAASPFAEMGYVDDAEIEAHVRKLLERRRAG